MSTLSEISSPEVREAVEALARDVLLRCWIRETGQPIVASGIAVLDLPGTRGSLHAEVTDFSPSGAHRFGDVRDEGGANLDLATIVEMVAQAASIRAGRGNHREARDRILESARRLADYAVRRAAEAQQPDLPRWLLAEQDLLSGHPWHPMTKSRDGLADPLDLQYSPEARGNFALHWYAAAPEVAAYDGVRLDVPAHLRRLAGTAADRAPADWLLIPVHPWQAADLPDRPAAVELLARGTLRDLGPSGEPWFATSSLRTVAQPGSDLMLKLSMRLRITNSRRENTRAEGLLAVHTARLVDAGLGAALARAHPSFGLILDRGWVGVDGDGPVGLETIMREAPLDPAADVRCAGSVVDPRPDLSQPPIAELVRRTAAVHHLDLGESAELWMRRWLAIVVEPLLWLHGTCGIGLEAHLQNVLVELGPDGLPTRGWYRDNQGWYAAESAIGRLATWLPDVGQQAPLVFNDQLVTDRLAYYLGVNHVLGTVAALAQATSVAEERLLQVVAEALRTHVGGSAPSPVARLLLDADRLPAKANLLTGVDGRDEVQSPVATQSVYVQIPNPIREASR